MKNKKFVILLISLMLLTLSACTKSNPDTPDLPDDPGIIEPDQPSSEEQLAVYQSHYDKKNFTEDYEFEMFYNEKHDFNEDYLFWLIFENQEVDQPVVYSKDNMDYLRVGFDGKKNSQGTPFLEYLADIESSNVTIYGHYVYYDDAAMFSPLSKLLKEENYEDFRYFDLIYPDRVRHFEIACVCKYEIYDENMPYWEPEFNDYYSDYIDYIKEQSLYDTGVKLTTEDKLCTIQTCIRNHDELREIIIAKEIFK